MMTDQIKWIKVLMLLSFFFPFIFFKCEFLTPSPEQREAEQKYIYDSIARAETPNLKKNVQKDTIVNLDRKTPTSDSVFSNAKSSDSTSVDKTLRDTKLKATPDSSLSISDLLYKHLIMKESKDGFIVTGLGLAIFSIPGFPSIDLLILLAFVLTLISIFIKCENHKISILFTLGILLLLTLYLIFSWHKSGIGSLLYGFWSLYALALLSGILSLKKVRNTN